MVSYEQWCADDGANSKYWLAEAKEYNDWSEQAKETLLTDIAPRIAQLGKQGYLGCGYHYGKEQTLGKLLIALAIPWQPSANHLDKIQDRFADTIVNKVLFDSLVEEVEEAEKTAAMTHDEQAEYMQHKRAKRAASHSTD